MCSMHEQLRRPPTASEHALTGRTTRDAAGSIRGTALSADGRVVHAAHSSITLHQPHVATGLLSMARHEG
jgi:hypothetical protein